MDYTYELTSEHIYALPTDYKYSVLHIFDGVWKITSFNPLPSGYAVVRFNLEGKGTLRKMYKTYNKAYNGLAPIQEGSAKTSTIKIIELRTGIVMDTFYGLGGS